MKTLFTAALLLAAGFCTHAADARKASTNGRSVYYPDGSHTECIQDFAVREQTEITYNAQNIKTARKVYLLNEQGLPMQGNIYDGRDQLKARAQFLFDEFGRLSEQRMINLQGEVFQRILFTYDRNGNQLPAKSQTYNVKAPDMKPATLDFTNTGSKPSLDRSQGDSTMQPPQGNVPFLPMNNGVKSTGGLAPIEVDMNGTDANGKDSKGNSTSKEGFFKRLFKKKDKDSEQKK